MVLLIKKIFKFLTSRVFITGALIAVQAAILVIGIAFLSNYFFYLYLVFVVLSIVITVYIVVNRDNPIYKLAWIIPILLFPVFGGLLYLLFGKRNISPKMRKQLEQLYRDTKELLLPNKEINDELQALSPDAAKQSHYLERVSIAPVWKDTEVLFLTPGEEKFAHLVEELKKAKHFIFLEYFIIEEGTMWNTVLDILVEKVKEGVDVRLLYDDLGTINLLPRGYDKKLRSLGLKVCVFNPFRPSLDTFMNYRDHRKIAVIDGHVGFTGGINLADEYINAYPNHGHWKDSSIMLKGAAVWNLTTMFLQIWGFISQETPDYDQYRPTEKYPTDGFIQPFGDSPIDNYLVGEMAYMNMINNATRYVYISTPYLILDNEMLTALCLAAENGIDVRIVTPHIADKWFVHEVTRSNYDTLIKAGVKIYEYTPGFIHAKTIVVDDELSIVGTTNFDFRSFYLHFECGVFTYRSSIAKQVYDDYMEILKVSQQITPEDCQKVSFFRRIVRAVLKVFAPLM